MSAPGLSPPSAAVAALYVNHRNWLYGWLRGRLGCAEDAADIAQDVFIRVLQKTRWQAPDEPRAYLVTIARGLMINLHHRRALERAYQEVLASMPEVQAPSVEQQQLILETLTQVQSALASLPPHVREVFLLSQLDGLTYPVIAQQCGLSLRTVKRYMVQGFACCLAAAVP